jgi:hypothetical protein
MFGYLKAHPRRKLAYDAQHPRISEKMFKQYDWFDFFRYSKEAIPYDMQKPRGNSMSKHCFVDASHGSDRATRRLQTGILIFCNRVPIIWHSKRQNTVDASTFGSKFQATKNAVELIESLRYKLRMFGVPIEGPTNIFVTTKRYTKNTSLPKSTLKKKHHLITYHRCCDKYSYHPQGGLDCACNVTVLEKSIANATQLWPSGLLVSCPHGPPCDVVVFDFVPQLLRVLQSPSLMIPETVVLDF